MADIKAPEISKELFGGIFDIDGAGHYPGLELINFIVCSTDGVLPLGEVKIRRTAHDFTRRLVRDKTLLEMKKREVLMDEHSEQAVSRLLKSLELELPNIRKEKTWERSHFFPFTRALVHWDARIRNKKVQLERRFFRGAGAYCFFVLRHDPEFDRIERIRKGFQALYPTTNPSPLDQLASTLRDVGIGDSSPAIDLTERNSLLLNDYWEELFRMGMDNILSYVETSAVERIRAIVTWTGLWCVFMMAGRTSKYLGRPSTAFILDCAGSHPQLRRVAQKSYKKHLDEIEGAATDKALKLEGQLSAKQLGKIRGFFGGTTVSCGVSNALQGRRHFTLKLEAIDTLVMAGIKNGKELEFERFLTEWLYEKCKLVIGRNAAGSEQLLSDLDATIFEENERSFAEQMNASGMLRKYSDATRMVSHGSNR